MQTAFYFSDDLQSTAANPSYFSNCLKPQNPLQPAPSPVGEGWGEGILQIAATFPNISTVQIQASVGWVMTQQNLSNYPLNVGFANPTYQISFEI